MAGGLTGGQIAQQLVVSPETIKSHVQNAMTKLGAHTRAHAVAIALRDRADRRRHGGRGPGARVGGGSVRPSSPSR